MSPSVAFFKFIFCNELGKSAEDRTLKIDTDFVLYEALDGGCNVKSATTIFRAVVTDLDEFERRLL